MTATTPVGQVQRDATGVRLVFDREFDAPAADVWSAITDNERLARWFGEWSGDPASGSIEVRMAGGDNGPANATVEQCDRPHRLVLTVDSPDGPWPLTVDLAERNGRTHLHFVHELAEPFDASGVGPGWQYFLDRLGAVIADRPVPSDFDRYQALSTAYPIPQPSSR